MISQLSLVQSTRIGRVDGHDEEPCIRCHLDEPLAELRGRESGEEAAEGPAAPSAVRAVTLALPSLLAVRGEIDVLDDDRPATVFSCESGQCADGLPKVPVARARRQSRQLDGHRGRFSDRVPARVDDAAGEVPVIEVDGEDRIRAQVAESRRDLVTEGP